MRKVDRLLDQLRRLNDEYLELEGRELFSFIGFVNCQDEPIVETPKGVRYVNLEFAVSWARAQVRASYPNGIDR